MAADKIPSILDKYEQKEIALAKRELIRNGLCDDEIQAQRNLEMDLEEREQLATGGGKSSNALRQFF